MDTVGRRRLSAMLVVLGVLGLAAALALLPTGLAAVGINALVVRTPLAIGIVADNFAAAVAGCLGALLFVAGGRNGYIGAGLGLVVAVGYAVGNWRLQLAVAVSGDPQPLLLLVLGLAVGTAVVSTLALLSSSSLRHEPSEPGESAPGASG